MLHKVIGLLLSAVVCTATSTLSNNNKSTFEIHRTLQYGHRQLSTGSSSYTTLPSYSSSSKSSKGNSSSRYYSSKSSKKRSRRRKKKYRSSSYDGSRDDGMEIGGGLLSSSSTLYTLQSVSSGSAESEDEINQHQFSGFSKSSKKHSFSGGSSFSVSKSSKKRGKSSKSSSSFGSSSHFSDSSSSFDNLCPDDDADTIVDVIREENGLDILETALEVAMLDDTLDNERGPFTLFGKLNCAF